jgi:hypothetical protein
MDNSDEHDEQVLLDALRSSLPPGEKHNAVMVAFDRLVAKRGEHLTSLITARAVAAHLNPGIVRQETLIAAFRHLKNQSEGEECFEFRGKPRFDGWLMSICGDHRKKRNGGVIPTLLTDQRRKMDRERLVTDCDEQPDERYDETKALLNSVDLEALFVGVDPTDRFLFELTKGGLSSAPSADSVIAHARQIGMTGASIDRLRHRALLMTWPKRKGRKVTYEELGMLLEIQKEEVRKRVRATLAKLRKGFDRTVNPYSHWRTECGRRTPAPAVEY